MFDIMKSERQIFLLWNPRNPLKSPDSDERIQGNPRVFGLVFLGFPWSGLVRLGLAWIGLEKFQFDRITDHIGCKWRAMEITSAA
jgi:hypothetical protein